MKKDKRCWEVKVTPQKGLNRASIEVKIGNRKLTIVVIPDDENLGLVNT